MPITWQKLLDAERMKLAPPLAWAIGAAAVISVFAVVVIIVSYAPLNNEAERRIESQLPASTYETIGALITATGNSCPRVCSISAVTSLTPSNTVDVACAATDDARSCLAPVHYRVNVETQTGPQR